MDHDGEKLHSLKQRRHRYARLDNQKWCNKRHKPTNANQENYHHRAKRKVENQNSAECRLLHAHRLPARRRRSNV